MEASTTIRQMLAGNRIFVPAYQRAYSWDTALEKDELPKQTNTFLTDLEEYSTSETTSPYYFGHFLFEETGEKKFGVIDGQQRLTTIVIFSAALFARLKQLRALSKSELEAYEDIIKSNSTYRFETVSYDGQLFRDYVVERTKKDRKGLETASAKRITDAFDFFVAQLADKDEGYLTRMLDAVQRASCTTHQVQDESVAIQMFIFQNNRGKKPSNLEIIKAQFMFQVYLNGGQEKDVLIEEIKRRFEKIYRSISLIEDHIDEDEVLAQALRVHFNSLWEGAAMDKINRLVAQPGAIGFIRDLTRQLAQTFEYLTVFFGEDERQNPQIHSLVTLGGIGVALPFVIKAYSFGLPMTDILTLCNKLESLVIRHRLVGTRAEINSRLNDVFQKFSVEQPDIRPIAERIDWMKNVDRTNSWWAYWNNDELEHSLQGEIHRPTAKYLLWRYENHLEAEGRSGYAHSRFDKIECPELEHIAPQTENPEAGYDTYDEEFIQQHINCLGNYLLLSKSHNCHLGNHPFLIKRSSYNHLEQQREIQRMTAQDQKWTRQLIQERKQKIIRFLMETI